VVPPAENRGDLLELAPADLDDIARGIKQTGVGNVPSMPKLRTEGRELTSPTRGTFSKRSHS
jgi:hypothetical protein